MLYELVCGDAPFYDDTLLGTYNKIQQHRPEKLTFPDDIELSTDAKDFLRRLLSRRNERIGKDGVDEIKGHAFFSGVNWEEIRQTTPPVVPELAAIDDMSNFSEVEARDTPEELFKKSQRKFEGNHLPFIGFTFSGHEYWNNGTGNARNSSGSVAPITISSDDTRDKNNTTAVATTDTTATPLRRGSGTAAASSSLFTPSASPANRRRSTVVTMELENGLLTTQNEALREEVRALKTKVVVCVVVHVCACVYICILGCTCVLV